MSPRFNISVVFVLVFSMCVCSVVCKNLEGNNKRTNCDMVKPFFDSLNITSNSQDIKGPQCGGSCCNSSTENTLSFLARGDFQKQLRHNSMILQGHLEITGTTLKEHVLALSRQSENKTLNLFSTVYQRMSALSRGPITSLYESIRRHVDSPEKSGSNHGDSDLETAIKEFFTELFPLAYHHLTAHNIPNDFAPDYKACLRQTYVEIKPFGDIPSIMSKSLYKSLETTRVLLQALALGADVLRSADTLLTSEENDACQQALLRMSYCPRCQGMQDHRPCAGFCLNVLRGCLALRSGGLDLPWNSYVEGVERLVVAVRSGVGVESVIRELDTLISKAVMETMEHGPDLEKQVKRLCGHVKLADKENPLIAEPTGAPINPERTSSQPHRLSTYNRQISPPDTQLLHFLASFANSKGFFATLADNLCKDESFVEKEGVDCWNGRTIGEYNEVVAPSSINSQKYNPEVKYSTKETPADLKISNLADQLRHIRQVVTSALSQNGEGEAAFRYSQDIQGDEAGFEGSGSGAGRDMDSVYSSNEDRDGSGSGLGEVPPPSISVNADKTADKAALPTAPSSGSTLLPTSLSITAAVILLSRYL